MEAFTISLERVVAHGLQEVLVLLLVLVLQHPAEATRRPQPDPVSEKVKSGPGRGVARRGGAWRGRPLDPTAKPGRRGEISRRALRRGRSRAGRAASHLPGRCWDAVRRRRN